MPRGRGLLNPDAVPKLMTKLALVVAVLALASCSAREKPGPGTSGDPVPSGSSSSSSSASEAVSDGTGALSVFAVEPAADTFTFDTAGVRSMRAGRVLITFENLGTMEHELRVMRINDGNFGAYQTAMQSSPATAEPLAAEAARSMPIDAAASSTVGAELSPGTYALVCLLSAPDGKAFAQHGMVRELVVSAG